MTVCPAPSSVTEEEAMLIPIPVPVIWMSVVSVHIPPLGKLEFGCGCHVPTVEQSPPLVVPDCPMLICDALTAASASGTINGIDGGTNSMLIRKIPKNIEMLFFLVIHY